MFCFRTVFNFQKSCTSNTEVNICVHASVLAQSCPTLQDLTDCSQPGSSVPGILSAGVGCLALLQGIFPTQRLNPGLLHYRWLLYHWATGEAPDYCIFLTRFLLLLTSYITIVNLSYLKNELQRNQCGYVSNWSPYLTQISISFT